MEEEKKYFSSIVEDNIRNLTSSLNAGGYTKEDIISCFYNPASGRYYVLLYR